MTFTREKRPLRRPDRTCRASAGGFSYGDSRVRLQGVCTLAAQTGATLSELMTRLGRPTPRHVGTVRRMGRVHQMLTVRNVVHNDDPNVAAVAEAFVGVEESPSSFEPALDELDPPVVVRAWLRWRRRWVMGWLVITELTLQWRPMAPGDDPLDGSPGVPLRPPFRVRKHRPATARAAARIGPDMWIVALVADQRRWTLAVPVRDVPTLGLAMDWMVIRSSARRFAGNVRSDDEHAGACPA